MSQGKRTALILAGALILSGLILGAIALGLTGFHPFRLGGSELEFGSQVILEPFDRLSLGVTACDVMILPTPDGQTRVEWLAKPDLLSQVRVENGTLVILEETAEEADKWYERISFSSGDGPLVAVYLARPDLEALSVEGADGDVLIQGLTVRGAAAIHIAGGDLTVEGMETFEAMDIRTTCGKVELDRVTAGSLTLKTTSGDMELRDCEAIWETDAALTVESSSGSLLLERVRTGDAQLHSVSGDITLRDSATSTLVLGAASGDLLLEGVDLTNGTLYAGSGTITLDGLKAESVDISTTSGNVRGTLSGPMRYEIQTTSGRVDVPPSDHSGGRCRVLTTSGDVNLAQG